MTVRRKKKSGAWKGFVAGMGLAGIFALALLWAVAGASGLKLREAFRSRMSVMADRADQFVDAWNRRSLPDKPGSTGVSAPEPKPARPSAKPGRVQPVSRVPAAPVSAPPPAPVAVPAAPAAQPDPPPPDKDVSPDDQQQLRELMRQLNQGR